MDDADLEARINRLVEEEHELEHRHGTDGLNEQELHRLRRLEISLDQTWDLLRQRRARRHAGLDPDGVGLRDPSTVEGYQQ